MGVKQYQPTFLPLAFIVQRGAFSLLLIGDYSVKRLLLAYYLFW